MSTGQFFTFCVPGGTPGGVMKLCHLAPNNRGRAVEIAPILLVGRADGPCSMLAADPLSAAPPTVS